MKQLGSFSDMPIRSAQTADLDAMMALTQDAFGDSAWSRRLMAEVLEAAIERPEQQLARIWEDPCGLAAPPPHPNPDRIAGYLIAQVIGRDAEIQSIAVWPGRQRQGVGTALLHDFMERARRKAWDRIFLEVRAGNEAAQKFYLRQGFEHYGRRPHYYHSPTEDACLMRMRAR